MSMFNFLNHNQQEEYASMEPISQTNSYPQTHQGINILITGTPGTGKTLLASTLAEQLGFRHLNISEIIIENKFYEEWDAEHDTWAVGPDDEDRLLDWMEPIIEQGNTITDYHSSEFFPERFFDLVIVTRCDNEILFKRLLKRGYKQEKVQENVECEIFQICLDEAKNSYKPEIVWELPSETLEQLETNVQMVLEWIQQRQ